MMLGDSSAARGRLRGVRDETLKKAGGVPTHVFVYGAAHETDRDTTITTVSVLHNKGHKRERSAATG